MAQVDVVKLKLHSIATPSSREFSTDDSRSAVTVVVEVFREFTRFNCTTSDDWEYQKRLRERNCN